MKILLLLLASCAGLSPALGAEFVLRPNDVLGIAGDSITQMHDYTRYVEDYLLMCHPTSNQRTMQFGWSGETAGGFLARIPTTVLPFHPTVMTTNYGMNDGHYLPLADTPNDPAVIRYRNDQMKVVELLKQNGVRQIILTSPKCIDPHFYKMPKSTAMQYNATMTLFAAIDREIAAKEGVIFADVNGDMLKVMPKAKAKFGEDFNFAGIDGIHPETGTQLIMAWTILRAMGCDGNIGTITVDYRAKKAAGSSGHEILSYQDDVVTLKSSRYPFCFQGTMDNPNDHAGDAALTALFPFNDDLNRYNLVVRGLPGAKASVTWGSHTREFAASDLAKGINLAAEFYDNPFSKQFLKVDTKVQDQQGQEQFLFMSFMSSASDVAKIIGPGAEKGMQEAIDAGMVHHDEIWKAAADTVIPVEHTITIKAIL